MCDQSQEILFIYECKVKQIHNIFSMRNVSTGKYKAKPNNESNVSQLLLILSDDIFRLIP